MNEENEEIGRIEKDPEGNLVLSIKYEVPGRNHKWHSITIEDKRKRMIKGIVLKTLYDELIDKEHNKDIDRGIMDALKTMKSCKTK